MSSVEDLFEEFVSRWRRDETIQVDALLSRAGPESDELARLIDEFLARAAAIAVAQARALWPRWRCA